MHDLPNYVGTIVIHFDTSHQYKFTDEVAHDLKRGRTDTVITNYLARCAEWREFSKEQLLAGVQAVRKWYEAKG